MKIGQNRRDFLKKLGFSAVALAFPGCLSTEQRLTGKTDGKKPNIILILIDDMGWTDLACFGSKYYETPNLDRLARQGMKFTNGYAACAVCSPTRAAVLTGRYPTRHGITDWIRPSEKKVNPSGYDSKKNWKLQTPKNHIFMEPKEITIAEALKPAGYISCHVGKWHLGGSAFYPEKQGFDYNIGGCSWGHPFKGYFDPYQIPTLPDRQKGEYLTDREAQEAVNFIRQHKDKPFFLYLAHYAIHSPIQAKKNLIEKYENKTPTNQKHPQYAAMVESVDHAAGKILTALDELKLTDNTLVIFTSDNGGATHFPATDNAPLRKGKGFPYEGGIREPLIIRWPGVIKDGSLCHEPVISMDFLPTICAAAGVKLPTALPIDGKNLMPLLTQTGTLNRDALYWHFPHYWWGTNVKPYSIIRAGDWKLIKHYENNKLELFNLKDDLSEKNDLAAQMPDKVKQLEAQLTAWLKQTGAKLPRPNPQWQKK
jgi:arylsulfatase A